MKRETHERPLSADTVGELRNLLDGLFHEADRTVEDNLRFYSVGMVLASPKVGVLASAFPAREALYEQVAFLKMVAGNGHMKGPHRDDALRAMKAISADLEFGRRN